MTSSQLLGFVYSFKKYEESHSTFIVRLEFISLNINEFISN